MFELDKKLLEQILKFAEDHKEDGITISVNVGSIVLGHAVDIGKNRVGMHKEIKTREEFSRYLKK